MQRLKELRTQRGLTQSQIGELLGVSCVTIARYEAGEREPSNAKLTTLANFFDVSIDYLMGRDEPAPVMSPESQALWQQEKALLDQLTDEQREQVNSYMRFLLSQNNK